MTDQYDIIRVTLSHSGNLTVEPDGFLRWDTGDRTIGENSDELTELRDELNRLGFDTDDEYVDHDTITCYLKARS